MILYLACIFSVFAKKPAYVKAADEAMELFNQSYCKEYSLEPLHQSGIFNKEINALFLDYEVKESLTEEGAKKLLIGLSNSFLNFLNERPDIQPYLAAHPFTAKEISISLYLPDCKTLQCVELSGDKISFHYEGKETKRENF